MKLFVYLILFLFTAISCVDNKNTVEIPRTEYNKLKRIKSPEYPKSFHFKTNTINNVNGWKWVIVLGQDNHEYLTNDANGNSFILLHYPDCKKCLKDTICIN